MRWNLSTKLVVAYSGLLALMAGALSVGIYWQLQRSQRAELQDRLLGTVSLAALQIDSAYQSVNDQPKDTDSDPIVNQKILQDIQASEPRIVRLYIVQLRNGHYSVTSDYRPGGNRLPQSPTLVGDVCSDLPHLLQQQTKIQAPITETTIRTNREGIAVLHGYAPIQSQLRRSDSILVIEMDATSVGQNTVRVFIIAGGILGVMWLIALPLLGWLARSLVVQPNLHSNHGILQLQAAFKELQNYSQNLEHTVKERTKELSESQNLLYLVINNLPQSIFWKDRENIYLGCNQSFAEVAGLEPGEIIGKTDYDMPWAKEEAGFYIECDRRIRESKEPEFGIIEPMSNGKGKQGWLETNKIPLQNLDGEVMGVIGIFQDITHYKEAEDAAHQANRTKTEFLANMSHELRTPLNAILGMADGLQEQVFGSINEKQHKALGTIESSGKHLLELINDILDLSKIESGHVALDCHPTAIAPLCNSSLAFIKERALRKQIHLKTELPHKSPLLFIDERRIRQVLINLLDNAVKFTPDGGCITLMVKSGPPLPISTQDSYKVANSLKISVIDTGIGIIPENIPKLFQPFIQIDSALNRQYNGTGLGLSLVKRIVKLHGGEVKVTSQVDNGSCFSITLPCANETQIANTTDASIYTGIEQPTQVNERGPIVLLTEDNEANVITLSNYLQAKGYHLIIARNGEEAISLSKSQQPDVIIMDIQMPQMDGLEAIRHIRRDPALAHIPIIALTALAMEGDRDRCLEAGANEYLSKPVKLKQLDQLIQQLLSNRNS
ncbi:ATP-binding protein [Leptothoe sp. LEGE 181152]|nr:ATP-binding protein [Leptothoe sp. LEGE 181152]